MNKKLKPNEIKVELEEVLMPRLRGFGMNWSCGVQKPFLLKPSSFTASIEGLKPKSFSQQKQLDTVARFLEDPTGPHIIAISSAPNDGQSKLLAAFLMQAHLKNNQFSRPKWHDITGGFSNPLLEDPDRCTMLVINNVGVDSTNIKKEKFRDILETYSDIPIVVVVNGSDGFTFMTRDMRKPVSGVVYLTNQLVKRFEL